MQVVSFNFRSAEAAEVSVDPPTDQPKVRLINELLGLDEEARMSSAGTMLRPRRFSKASSDVSVHVGHESNQLGFTQVFCSTHAILQ